MTERKNAIDSLNSSEKERVNYFEKNMSENAVFKFSNPWIVKTPPGYSCIFTQPFNRNAPFKIIDGIVDTDTYQYPVFFPFYWTADWKNDDTLEAGSPMVLIIPFKRESWKHETKKIDDQTYRKTNVNHFRSFWNNYRNKFWRFFTLRKR